MTMVDDTPRPPRPWIDPGRLSGRLGRQAGAVVLHSGAHPDRGRVEDFLEDAYARAFDAEIRHHYPTLMSVQDDQGEVLAAAGFRLAGEGPLFLEQYLDAPVEDTLGQRLGVGVDRRSVAEIGSLACEAPGASLRLFLALADHLDRSGCAYAVATATRQLRRSFARVGFATRALTHAEPARLGEAAGEWGGYYSREPQVLAGAIAPALAPLRQVAPLERPQ